MQKSELFYLKRPERLNGRPITAIRVNRKASGALEVFHLYPDATGVLVSNHSDLLFDARDQSDFWDWLASLGTTTTPPPHNADQSLDNPENKAALKRFFAELAELDADRTAHTDSTDK